MFDEVLDRLHGVRVCLPTNEPFPAFPELGDVVLVIVPRTFEHRKAVRTVA